MKSPKPPDTRKTVLYMRVSTDEQSVEPQRRELTEYCAFEGITIHDEYCDIISGAKMKREGLDALLADCKSGLVGRVLTVRIDRVARSLSGFVRLVDQFNEYGVALVCPGQGINTESEKPEGMLIRHVLTAMAEFERALIRQRTKEGLAAAKAAGKICGQPSEVLVKNWPEVVAAWKAEEPCAGYAKLARRLGGVSKSTAWRLANKA